MPFLQSNTLDCKNGIVFAYQQDWRPAAASGNIAILQFTAISIQRIAIHRKGLRDKSVSKNDAIFCLPASFAPRRGERQ
jgi:hypothetical protein